jgi:hypothetical protein
MNRVPAFQQRRIETRYRNSRSLELVKSPLEPVEILLFGQNKKINVLANLRRAVEYAGLPSHEQRADAIDSDRRKDLPDRGRDQGYLPWPDNAQKTSRSP